MIDRREVPGFFCWKRGGEVFIDFFPEGVRPEYDGPAAAGIVMTQEVAEKLLRALAWVAKGERGEAA